MIKDLQKKFILVAMLAIIIVTGSLFGLIIAENYSNTTRQMDALLDLITNNNGVVPEYRPRDDALADVVTKETQFSTRYFIIRTNDAGEIVETDMRSIAAIGQEEASHMLKEVFNQHKDRVYYKNYRYKIEKKDNGKWIAFLDCTLQLNAIKSLINQSLIIIFVGMIVIFILVSIYSKRALAPVIENIEKQKQFITNAGHELKTPVAVIMANADVMEMTSTENLEWIRSIKKQASRLDVLIKSLLSLCSIQGKENKMNYTSFSIKQVIEEEIVEFKAIAKDKEIEYNPKVDIKMYADINSIKQLVTILLDNALKYTPENGEIKIITEKQGKNVKMQFMNDCEDPYKVNTTKMFDRFYRGDLSRSKAKEGYGIGLSIAQSIVEAHKGKIYARILKGKMICFTIII